ncbi:hypothetical protein [Streptomyces alkaliterrae]|uniref:Alpha-amylase n=1 Tax=Streptomyces alkaliterrae TaxID=2213162 RepID=A0A5P0YQ38_9ACTN|nr:hypothetical protein [Streptomyces alkaliterrae]MBB1256979.1 hypothetical protein [Streptomyces alkaliterrae]MBB1262420.1 hypothetical protein [Streptomyces alkaliterrae]MQS02030.1 hypothetical protein [Streptomyces alkaliterrae]
MSWIRKTSVTAMALAAAGLSVVATAPAAQAKAGDTAPSCVNRYIDGDTANRYVYVSLTNNCKTTKKVKVDIRLGKDSPCWTLKPGANKKWTYEGIGSYRKTVLC